MNLHYQIHYLINCIFKAICIYKISNGIRSFFYTTIVLLFVTSTNVMAQQHLPDSTLNDTAIANAYFSKGERLFEEALYDSSIAFFKKACTIYKRENLVDKYVQCYNRIGENLISDGEYERSLSYLNKALETGINILGEKDLIVAESYNNLGMLHDLKGNYDKALELYNKSLSIRLEKLGNKHPDVALSYNNIGGMYSEKCDYNKALEFYHKALSLRLEIFGDKHPDVAVSYNDIGIVYGLKADYVQSLELFHKALSIIIKTSGNNNPNAAEFCNNLGYIYNRTGDYDKALEYYNRSLSIKLTLYNEKHPDIARAYNNLGILYHLRGNYDKAFKFYNIALNTWLEILGDKHPDVAISYNNVGAIYREKGDYNKALEFFQKALSIEIEILSDKHPNIASSYNNIASIYQEKGDYDKTLEFYYKALSIMLETVEENHPEIAKLYNNITIVYYYKGDYDKALELCNKALSIRMKTLSSTHPDIAQSYYNVGYIYHLKGDYNKTYEFYNKSLSIRLKVFGDKHPDIAYSYHGLGKTCQKQNDLIQALGFYQKSMITLISDFNAEDIYANPSLNNISSEPLLLSSLEFKAETFEELYSKQTKNLEDIKISMSTYELASKLIEKMQSGFKAEGSKLILAEQANKIYNKAIRTAFTLYQVTEEEVYKKKAFAFAEKNKISILRQSLAESQAKKFAGIPDTLFEKEKQLKIDLSFYNKNLLKEQEKGKETDSISIQLWQNKLFALSREYDTLIEQFEEKYPAYYNLKYQFNTISPYEIQKKIIDEYTALVEYNLGDSNLFIFTITKEDFDITPVPIDSLFYTHANRFCGSIRKLEMQEYLKYSNYLYKTIIQPVREKITSAEKIIIIPDGILHYIPFEALVAENQNTDQGLDFTKLDYLINDYAISYHYSSSLLAGTLTKQQKFKAANFIGFAPVFSSSDNDGYVLSSKPGILDSTNLSNIALRSVTVDGKKFTELPMSQKEVSSIVRLFEKNKGEAKGYFHNEATEENFKSEAVKNNRYIHIATHGLINEKKPALSGLIFSQTEDTTSAEDGILYSGETYNLSLNSDLVVLSSCESGIGLMVKGEGIMALTRGFLYSGASNILFSLWKVNDKPTSELMVKFYKNMFDQKDYASALRLAKLSMIKNKNTAFPKNWSSFVLVGK